MSLPGIRNHVARLRQQTIRNAHWLNERTHGWLGMLAVSRPRQRSSPNQGSWPQRIAYYALFSLFPLRFESIAIKQLQPWPGG